jgi:hypothetical protein
MLPSIQYNDERLNRVFPMQSMATTTDEFIVTDLPPLSREVFEGPKKKKKIIIDTRIQLTSKQVRSNVNDPSDLVTSRPVVVSPHSQSCCLVCCFHFYFFQA